MLLGGLVFVHPVYDHTGAGEAGRVHPGKVKGCVKNTESYKAMLFHKEQVYSKYGSTKTWHTNTLFGA